MGFEETLYHEDFEGKTGDITKLIENHVQEHLLHFHVTMHEGFDRLGYWARDAIKESGTPLLYANERSRVTTLMPPTQLYEKLGPTKPYTIEGDGMFIRLDALPDSYSPSSANKGGQKLDERFSEGSNALSESLKRDVGRGFFDTPEIADLVKNPNIMTGAKLVGFSDRPWAGIVHYGASKLGIWTNQLYSAKWTDSDQCVEHYPDGFDYETLIPIINEFGGWIDFRPGLRGDGETEIVCNFTVSRNGERTEAIVQDFHIFGDKNPKISRGQREFLRDVIEAFQIEEI